MSCTEDEVLLCGLERNCLRRDHKKDGKKGRAAYVGKLTIKGDVVSVSL